MTIKDISNGELSDMTGLNYNYITDLRGERVVPGVYNALLIAKALNVHVDDIWYLEGNEKDDLEKLLT